MERKLSGLSILFFLFTYGPFLNAQTLPPEISVFSPKEDYEGHQQLFCVEPLKDGRRVFGTAEELLLHDGEKFSKIPVGPGNYVYSMERDDRGLLYVGGNAFMGVVLPDSTGRLKYRSLTSLLPDSLQNIGTVWDIHSSPEGGVYFNAQDRIFYYQESEMEVLRPEKSFYRLQAPYGKVLTQDPDTAFFHLQEGEKRMVDGSERLGEQGYIQALLPATASEDEEEWVAITATNGLYRYEPHSETLLPFPEAPEGKDAELLRELQESEAYKALRLDPEQNPYRAAYLIGTTQRGLFFLDQEGSFVLHLDREDGLPSDFIWDLSADERGNVWVATENGIALVHTGVPFSITPEGESYSGAITDIARFGTPTPSGKAPLFLASSKGLWSRTKEESGFRRIEGPMKQCFELLPFPESASGENKELGKRLLVGSNDGLLSMENVKGRGGELLSPAQTLMEGRFTSLGALPASRHHEEMDLLLAGGEHGVFILEPPKEGNEEWMERLSLKEVPDEVLSVGWDPYPEEADSIRIWAGMFSKGVVGMVTDTAFSGYRSFHYDSSDGLPEATVQILRDPSGEGVLFGTDEGLREFKEGAFPPYCEFGKLFCDSSRQVYGLEKGPRGKLWIMDEFGGHIKQLIREEGAYRVDGLPFAFPEIGAIRSILPEKDRIWLGGGHGLACYFPELEKNIGMPWDCRIREVRGAEDSLLFGGNFWKEGGRRRSAVGSTGVGRIPVEEQPEAMVPVLPYSANRLFFEYAAAFPDRQEKVRYSYKLEGFDTTWSKMTRTSEKEYTNLPEGDYVFKVKAKNVYEKKSSTAEYRFRILPPWYRTWWAYSGYSLSSIGFIWLVLWLNGPRLLAQNKRLERIVEERTRTIREQKEETERQKERVEEAHKEITDSIDYAQKIQNALLHSQGEYASPFSGTFTLFKPQSRVSGDFYWSKEHKGHRYIAAVDCTGHGVPGAFMSMLGISQLNEIMNTNEVLSPGEILTELKERIIRELSGSNPRDGTKDGMDAAVVKIPNPNSKSQTPKEELAVGKGQLASVEVQFAGANNPLYVVREGIAEDGTLEKFSDAATSRVKPFKRSSDGIEIKGDKQSVGYDEHAKGSFTTITLQLRKGDMLYIFSDGYADQFGGPKGKKFRYGPFKQLLAGLHAKTLKEQRKELERTFEDWKAESEQEQVDDVVVIGVRL